MIAILFFLATAKGMNVVACSSSTPESLKAYFSSDRLLQIDDADASALIHSLESLSIDIIIDLTLQPYLFPLFDTICEYFSTFYLTISPSATSSFSSYRFHAHNSFESMAYSLSVVAKGLNWTRSVILYSFALENLKVADKLSSTMGSIATTELSFDSDITQESANLLIGKMVKSNGIANLIVLAYGGALLTIQRALIQKKLLVAGNIFIFPSKAIWGASIVGSMIVVEKGLEFTNSWEEYEFLSVVNAMKKLKLSRDLVGAFKNNIINTEYSLVNIKNQGRVIVGTIGNSLVLNDTFIYPGNTSVYNSRTVKQIFISIANGTNITDSINSQYQHWYMGAIYAAQLSNRNNEIPNFEIELQPTGCDSTKQSLSWFLNCMKNQKFGVAYLTGQSALSSVFNMYSLRAYKKFIPQLSPLMTSDLLNNLTEYPEFLKMSISFSNYFLNAGFAFTSFGYSSIAILSSNDSVYLSVYKSFVHEVEQRGIQVVNPFESRFFHPNYTSDQFEAYKEKFMAVKNSGVRSIILFGAMSGELAEGLYDVGLRKGDIIFFGTWQIKYEIIDPTIAHEKLMKRCEMLSGAMPLAYKEYSGSIGPKLKAEMSELYGDVANLCFSYDSFQVIKDAIKHAVRNGLDYEDPYVLLRYMRLNRIEKCLGNIFFDPESNSRSQAKLLLEELIIDPATCNISVLEIAVVDVLSDRAIYYLNDPYWYSGTTTVPSEFRSISRCPFDSYQIQQSSMGSKVLYCFVYGFLLYLIIISLLFYKISDKSFSILTTSTPITSEDMVCIVFFFFEALQVLLMGPDQEMYTSAVKSIMDFASLEFDNYFQFKDEKYWILLNTVVALSSLLNFMAICVILRVNSLKYFICDKFNDFFRMYCPLISHIGFLPVISMLLSILLCDNGIGDELNESFLNQDCSVFCYRDKHLVYTTISLITLALFIPLAIYCRYLWLRSSVSLNINTKSAYICFLSSFQMLLIALNKSTKQFNQGVHGLIVIFLIIVFLVVSIRNEPYSYQRANVFQCTALMFALWGVICATGNQFSHSLTMWSILELIGFVVIILGGLYLSTKYPKLLYSQKGNKVPVLFLFQCFKKYEDYVVRNYNHIINSNRNSTYKIEDSNFDNILE